MENYEIKLDIAVEKTIVVRSKSEDDALEEVYKRLEEKGIDRARILDLKLKQVQQVEKVLDSTSPSKMTN